jgi:signal transduction histidine kinase
LFRALIKRFRSHNNKILDEYKNRQAVLEATIIERIKDIQKEKEIADQQRKRAEESEKFKQQFLANMSHEIRTPMNSIVGLSNLLINSPLNDNQKKYLNVIRKSSDNLLVIINDILDLSKIQAGKMEFEAIPFMVSDVLETVYHTLRFKAEDKNLDFNYALEDSVPKVLIGDPVRLNQVLINIIGNAIKFTEKGFVKFTVEVEEYTNQIVPKKDKVKKKLDDGKNKMEDENQTYLLKFSVTDSGIGMNEAQQKKVFESFSQASSDTTRKYGGTGLGLTISKQLVESQGGTINLTSEPGKGTTFFFTLNFPLGSIEEIEKKEIGNNEDFAKHLSGLKVLLVEDNPFNQMVAEDTIKEMIPDIIIEIAENGLEALDMISKNDYDIVLMDINMPEMDGYDATKNIRLMPPPKNKIPIIAMTASVTKEEIDKCFSAGMDEYVPKPFQPQDLLAKMKGLRNKI